MVSRITIKNILFLFALVLLAPLARGNQNAQGWCEVGATPVVTSGLTSTTTVQASYPACTVTVFVHGAGLATIFSDNNGTPLSNPFTAQANGRWQFYSANGRYDVQLSGAGFPTPVTYSDVVLQDAANQQAALPNTTLTFSATPVLNVTNNVSYTMTLTGNVTSSTTTGTPANGNILSLTLVEDGVGGRTFAFPANFIIPLGYTLDTVPLHTNAITFKFDGTNWNVISNSGTSGGGGSAAQGVVGTVQTSNGAGVLAASGEVDTGTAFNVSRDAHFKGPNPVVDVTQYGVRSACASAAPCAPGITATTTSGLPTITLSSASTFQNGDGVTIYGAGAAHSMTTPTAPTVTPSLSAGPAVTGPVVNGPSGSTTYNYKVMARNTAQGLTAASATGSTTTGVSTLGYSTVGITSQSRSGTVTTVTTSSAHGLAVGVKVNIFQATDGPEFSGWFIVATVPDTTHFTYTNGIDAAGIITSTTSTGGTVSWEECNHLTWPAVTGASQYVIYSDRANPGTFAPIGISEPNVTSWDDYGSPMMDGLLLPYFIPSTPPVAATSNSLTTTILSGAGTTSLTLNANAGTSVSGATILFDNAPNFVTAVAAGGTTYFPAGGTYVFNSYVTTNASVSIGGQLWLNDTMQVQGKWTGSLTPTNTNAPQFSFEAENIVNVNRANPGLYSAAFNSSTLRGLTFSPQGKSGRAILMQGSIQGNYEWLNCALLSADYTGICLELHGVTADVFFNTFRNIAFTSPQGLNTSAPLLALSGVGVAHGVGITQMENFSLSGRGIHSDASEFYVRGGRCQACSAPIFTYVASAQSRIENIDQDTMTPSLIANFGAQSSLYIKNSGSPSFDGVSSQPVITGKPFGSVAGDGVSGQNTNQGNFGFTSGWSGTKISSGTAVANFGQGSSASIGYQMTTGTPTVSISGATGPAAGTYYYSLEAVDALGNATAPGNPSTSITVNGSQGVLITFPTRASGQVFWNVCRSLTTPSNIVCAQGGTPGTNGFQVSASLASIVDNGFGPSNSANNSNNAATSFLASTSLGAQNIVTVGGGFTSTASGTFTANRTVTEPDFSYTRAGTNIAQTFTANQSIANGSALRFFAPNGTTFTGLTGPATNGTTVTFQLPSSDSSGVQCISSNGSGVLAFSNCSAGTGTPGGANKNFQYNNASSFGGTSNGNYTSATGVFDFAQLANSNNTITGHRFTDTSPTGNWLTFQNAALNSTLFNVDVAGNLTANSATLTTPLAFANGGTNSAAGFTNNQLVVASSGALASLTGTLTGTNPVLTLTSAAIGNVPFALNTPASPTADLFDLNINAVKTSWFDNTGVVHAPSFTATGSGPLVLSGTEGACPSPAAGIDILCLGNSSTHTIQSSLNGTTFKDNSQWTNSNPIAHGVALVGVTFPQVASTGAGTSGQPLISGGASADPAYGTLGAVGGGTGNATNTAHGVLVGEGTSPVALVGPDATSNQPLLSAGASADPVFGALPLGNASAVSGVLPTANGGTGASSLSGANIATVTGAITIGDCTKWSSSTVITDSGSPCGGGSAPARLDQITPATASNTINSTVNPQIWNWALTGSTTAFKFGENTAATGSNNVLLQSSTLNTSTAVPFQADSNGNGYQLSSAGLLKPIGTGAFATPGAAHNLVVSQAGSTSVTYIPPVTAGKVLIDNGPGNDPSFQDPIVSQAFVNLWTAQDITVTRTSANVRNPIFSQTGTFQITFASITGSPSGCTLQVRGVDSQANVLNNGSTLSVTPSNGTTSQTFTASATLQTAAQISVVYACSTYPTAGTLTLDFTPIPNVNVTNTVTVSGTVTTTPPANASTNVTQFGGNAVATGTGAGGVGIPRVTISNDSSLAANQSVNVAQVAGTATDTNSGTKSAGTQRIVIATDQPQLTNALKVDGSAVTQPVSGTVTANAGTGNFNAIGTLSSNGAAAATNRVGVLEGIAQTDYNNGTAATQGRDVAPNVGTDGLLWTANLPAMRPASYVASKKFAASSTTDVAVLPGNATNTVLVTRVLLSCTQTTAGNVNVEMIVRSTADTSGTSAAMTVVPDDSNYAAGSSAPLSYTGTGPTVGTAVGDVDNYQLGCMASGTATPNDIYVLNRRQKPIVLRGTAQQLAINLGGAVTGGNITVTFEWLEVKTITP